MKKIICLLLTFCLGLAVPAACGKTPEGDTRPIISRGKVAFYGDDNGERLHNPLMGWSYYGFPEEIAKYGIPDDFDVGIILCSWDQMEKQRGIFDFSLLTKAIDRLRKDGKTVYLRLYLMPDDVWEIEGYPAWVKYVPDVGTFKDAKIFNNNKDYYFQHPEYSNPVYQNLVKTFLTALCAEYEDGAIDVIDSRAYGLYGEWDSEWGNYWDTSDPNYKTEKSKVLNDFVDIYAEAFAPYRLTKIAINVPSKSCFGEEEFLAYEKEAAYDNAMKKGFALRFDAVENVYYKEKYFFEWLRAKNYPQTPVFAESCWGMSERTNVVTSYASFCAARANVATFGFYKGNYERILDYPYDYLNESLVPSERFDNQTIGYRIYPTLVKFSAEANVGGKIEFESAWVNTGSGVLYRDYPLCLSLADASGKEVYVAYRDEDFDLTSLLKESEPYEYATTFNLPGGDSLPAGTYTLRIALADRNNNGKSAVAMPIGKNADTMRDYALGKITLK